MTNVYMTKSGFIEDKNIFNHFKEEATIVAEDDIGCIDEGLEVIIYLLNKFPGIATRWSCTGHPDRSDSDDFHIITVVHDQESFERFWKVSSINTTSNSVLCLIMGKVMTSEST